MRFEGRTRFAATKRAEPIVILGKKYAWIFKADANILFFPDEVGPLQTTCHQKPVVKHNLQNLVRSSNQTSSAYRNRCTTLTM